MVTIATSTLISRALEADLVVSCVLDGNEITRASRKQRDGEPDVVATVVSSDFRRVRAEPVSLAGQLLLSVLCAAG